MECGSITELTPTACGQNGMDCALQSLQSLVFC